MDAPRTAGHARRIKRGRITEQRLLEVLAAREPPRADLVVCGPRGHGKTVLLGWTQRTATEKGINAVSLSASEAVAAAALAARLASQSWLSKRLSEIS